MPIKRQLKLITEHLLHPLCDQSLGAQAIRQVLGGVIVTLIDFFIFQSAIVWLSFTPPVAAVISWTVALFASWAINRYYVFGEVKRQKISKLLQLLFFSFVALVSLGIIQFCIFIFTNYLSLAPIIAKIMSLPIIFIWTLSATRCIVFSKK